MLKIFISYGRADARDLAIQLRDSLTTAGYNVWLDLNEIPGGASWSQNIESAIEHCELAIALMSHASYESQWCRAEQLRATRKGKRLIPLLVQKDAEIPLHLEHLNYLDFSDTTRYSNMFRDLLSDINAGQAFRQQSGQLEDQSDSPFKKKPVSQSRRGSAGEKRSAPAFRRHLAQLRGEDWLGARYWWPYFLFYYTDIHSLIDVLAADELRSSVGQGGSKTDYWDHSVRLYFRPRPPSLWRNEGFRPSLSSVGENYCPIPVYLLFDMEAVICHPESRFCDGDPAKSKRTYRTPHYFRELPFEQIYHDSWFMPDERDDIMRSREAQVLIPNSTGLESLQLIWVRSDAEYETLRSFMPPDIWAKWRDKITTRTDYHLFNRKWVYVDEAHLTAGDATFRFHPPENEEDRGPFNLTVEVRQDGKPTSEWTDEDHMIDGDVKVMLPENTGDYEIRLLIDGDVAYAGHYKSDSGIF